VCLSFFIRRCDAHFVRFKQRVEVGTTCSAGLRCGQLHVGVAGAVQTFVAHCCRTPVAGACNVGSEMQTRAATGVQAAPVSRSVWGRQALRWAAGRARWGFAHPENGSLDLGDVRVLDECAGQTIWARGSAPCATVGWRPHGRSAGILRLMGPTTGSVPPGGCRKVLYHLPPPTPKNRKFPVIFIEIACFWTLKYPVF